MVQKELKQRHESRRAATIIEKVRDTLVGVGIIALVGFLNYTEHIGELWFGLGMVFGGMFISKSLGLDFIGAVKDKIKS